MQEKILIIDFGSQYTQLIARRVRELSVYCEIHPFNHLPAIDASVRGVILSGSPFSVRDAEAPRIDLSAIKGRLPLLGVCYGAQYLAQHFGGEVTPAPSREYGRAMLTVVEPDDRLMEGLPRTTQVWMSHGDTITRVPDGYRIVASTAEVHVAAYRIEGEPTWAIQFHPEVYHSTDGVQLLRNFVVGICGCAQSWTSESFVETTVRELREKTTRSCWGFRAAWTPRLPPCCCTAPSARTCTASSSIRVCCARTSSKASSIPTRAWDSTSRASRPATSSWATWPE